MTTPRYEFPAHIVADAKQGKEETLQQMSHANFAWLTVRGLTGQQGHDEMVAAIESALAESKKTLSDGGCPASAMLAGFARDGFALMMAHDVIRGAIGITDTSDEGGGE